MPFMLDTNICIYIIKKKPDTVLRRLHRHLHDGLSISSITLSELTYGVVKSSRPDENRLALIRFLMVMTILPYDEHAARHYGEIRTGLERDGRTIGPLDMLIASHARSLRMMLVTNNTKEFSRVPGLLLENWADSTDTITHITQ